MIAPLACRSRPGAKLLYRQPAYLIVSDPHLPLQRIVRHYVQRWDIEVNFRDEKTLPGVGEAQVRHPRSVAGLPRMIVAAYSWLLLAARRAAEAQASPDASPTTEVASGQEKAAGGGAGPAAAIVRRARGRRPAAFLQLSFRRRPGHEAPETPALAPRRPALRLPLAFSACIPLPAAPAKAKLEASERHAPRADGPLTHFASPRGKKSGLTGLNPAAGRGILCPSSGRRE